MEVQYLNEPEKQKFAASLEKRRFCKGSVAIKFWQNLTRYDFFQLHV